MSHVGGKREREIKSLRVEEEAAKHPAGPVLGSRVAGAKGGGTSTESGRDGVPEEVWRCLRLQISASSSLIKSKYRLGSLPSCLSAIFFSSLAADECLDGKRS